MIINNTGLNALGQTGHKEIDSVTFERGKPCFVDKSQKPIAGEMCQVLNDHWGYCKNDVNYKSIKELIENLIDCRKYGCNFLLNAGLMGNGELKKTDSCMLEEIGEFIKVNKGFIYNVKPCDIAAENADVVTDGEYYYAILKDVGMSADPNVAIASGEKSVKINAAVKTAVWLDNGKKIKVKRNSFAVEPFAYGASYSVRVAKIKLK